MTLEQKATLEIVANAINTVQRKLRREQTEAIHRLEREVSELRGELRAMKEGQKR